MLQASVIIVSTILVVSPVIVATAFASIRVPLGLLALSVSILNFKSTDGDTNCLRFNFRVLKATQFPTSWNSYLVLAVTSQMLATFIAIHCAGDFSKNTHCHAVTDSPSGYVLSSIEDTHICGRIATCESI